MTVILGPHGCLPGIAIAYICMEAATLFCYIGTYPGVGACPKYYDNVILIIIICCVYIKDVVTTRVFSVEEILLSPNRMKIAAIQFEDCPMMIPLMDCAGHGKLLRDEAN